MSDTLSKARELAEDAELQRKQKPQEFLNGSSGGLQYGPNGNVSYHWDPARTEKQFVPEKLPDAVTPSTPGVKFDDDKVAYHLLPPLALQGTAWVFKYGGVKYAAWNHSNGMDWSKMYRAALGHTLELGMGNFLDDETKLGHVYHAICSLMMLAEGMILHPDKNDLYPKQYKEKAALIKAHQDLMKHNALAGIQAIRDEKSKNESR